MAEYAETVVMEAALAEDQEWGMDLLHEFLPGELENMKDACLRIMQWCNEAAKTVEARAQARDLVALRDELRG